MAQNVWSKIQRSDGFYIREVYGKQTDNYFGVIDDFDDVSCYPRLTIFDKDDNIIYNIYHELQENR